MFTGIVAMLDMWVWPCLICHVQMNGIPEDCSSNAHVLVLLSGGVDSAACAAFFVERKYHVEAMHLDYGQAAAEMEFNAAHAIAEHYTIKLHYHRLSDPQRKNVGHIVGRNAFLLFAALLEFPWDSGLIGIGIHTGTPYFDCTKDFTERVQRLFDAYSDGRIRISAPFLMWEKPRIWDFCMSSKVPVSLTYSCEAGSREPCGECSSCKDLEVLHGKH
jgi:7-cyano-7-deazaguanine synthase